jgi:hypothetical protein
MSVRHRRGVMCFALPWLSSPTRRVDRKFYTLFTFPLHFRTLSCAFQDRDLTLVIGVMLK